MSPLLSTEAVAGLRNVVANYLSDTCTIERASQASDGQGGQVDTWADLTTGIACAVRQSSSQGAESVIADKLTADQRWAIVLPANTGVTVKDRIVVTSQSSRRFEVAAVLAPRTVEVDRTCICAELS